MKNHVLWSLAMVLSSCHVLAQKQQDSLETLTLDEVVVSDSRFQLKRENSGKTVIKISRQELERNQGRTVAELINTKSGIEINGTRSYAGQNLSTYVRGGNNRQVLVVIDGIQVSDPSNPNAEYDLRLLNSSQIERIEILKGAASTLYGNSAATAVISITTKKAESEGLILEIQSSMGTNQAQENQDYSISDFSNTLNLSTKKGKISFLASGGQQFTDGLSAAIGTESDALSRIDGNLKLGYQVSKDLEFTASVFYNKLNSDYDNGFPIEDADFLFTGEQSRFGLSGNYGYENGSITVNTAFSQIDRSFVSNFPSAFDSQSIILDVFNKYNFAERLYTIVGLNYIENQTLFSGAQYSDSWDPYLNLVYIGTNGFNLNTGLRLNNHSSYGSNFIYNINPSYRLRAGPGFLKFMGSYATSYIAPNLSQLFGPFGPNPDLNPEENRTLEGGFEYSVSRQFTFNALYFDRAENERIEYVTINETTFESQYRNAANTVNFNGIEVGISAILIPQLTLNGNYTFTRSNEGLALRVPKNKVNASLGYEIDTSTFIELSYQYVSKRSDTDFATFENVILDSFSLVNIQARHQFSTRFNAFIAMENIFNESYTELLNYTTRGRNIRVGFNLTL